eukprot:8586703-Pyramimonas_sp.AAC.1
MFIHFLKSSCSLQASDTYTRVWASFENISAFMCDLVHNVCTHTERMVVRSTRLHSSMSQTTVLKCAPWRRRASGTTVIPKRESHVAVQAVNHPPRSSYFASRSTSSEQRFARRGLSSFHRVRAQSNSGLEIEFDNDGGDDGSNNHGN